MTSPPCCEPANRLTGNEPAPWPSATAGYVHDAVIANADAQDALGVL